mgnify:CR=1 FL=1
MAYYHDLVTQKSWEELTRLTKLVPCVTIGGWAVYLYTKALKSKDIDILVDFDALSTLKDHYDIIRNDRLKKYQATRDMVEIDIYLPHYSMIGIPVENLIGKTRAIEGFTVVDPDYLCALKLYALGERGRTPKGRKDFLDILSLFISSALEAAAVRTLITRYHLEASLRAFVDFLSESQEIPELDLSTHRYAKVKRAIIKDLSLG